MSRPRYSRNAIVRAVEMSRCTVTVFVEGFLDRAFFGEILRLNSNAVGKVFRIRFAHELDPSLGNGKTALLELHAELTKHGRLMYVLGTEKKAVLIFLDKDIDELKRLQRKCQHAIYTKYYSVENYLYCYGDLVKGLTCGACLDGQSVRNFPTNSEWTKQAASAWAEWMAFCLMTSKMKSDGLPNFGAKSLIHRGEYKPLNKAEESKFLQVVSKRTGLKIKLIRNAYLKELNRVTNSLKKNTFNNYFNGKWYLGFLAEDAKRIAAGRKLPQGFAGNFDAVLMSTLNFNDIWAEDFQYKVSKVLKQI